MAVGGLVGPLGFVAAWAIAGATTKGYSPVESAISRLAAVHAPTRALMTAGFICFGAGVPVYALSLRDALPSRAWVAATTAGVATLGVAACPLDVSTTLDAVHGALAATAYASLALTPVLAAGPLARRGRQRASRASVAIGAVAGACLAATVLGPAHGLFQRLGLTIVDVWLVASASAILHDRRELRSHQ